MFENKMKLIRAIIGSIIFVTLMAQAKGATNCQILVEAAQEASFKTQALFSQGIELERQHQFQNAVSVGLQTLEAIETAKDAFEYSRTLHAKCPHNLEVKLKNSLNKALKYEAKANCHLGINQANISYSKYLETSNQDYLENYIQQIKKLLSAGHCSKATNKRISSSLERVL